MFAKLLFEFLTLGTLLLLVPAQDSSDSDVCTSQRCLNTANMFLKNMDLGVLPCHNFYDFMCRNFPKWNHVADGNGRESAFTIRERYIDEKFLGVQGVHSIHEEYFEMIANKIKVNPKETYTTNLLSITFHLTEFLNSKHVNFPVDQKARIVYQNCMDEATLEKIGSWTVPLELNAIGLPISLLSNPPLVESYNLSRLLARLHRQASYAKFIFDVTMSADLYDKNKNYLSLSYAPGANKLWIDGWSNGQEAFGIRSPVSSHEEEAEAIEKEKEQKLMKEAVQYMSDLTNQRITEKTEKLIESRIQRAIDFLVKLRKISNIENLQDEPTKITIVELQKKTDDILVANKSEIKFNWLDYVETLFENIRDDARQIFESGEPILIDNVKQFEAVLGTVAATNQKVFVSAMWWIATRSVSAFGSKELRRIYYDSEVLFTKTEIAPRQERCLNVVKNQFPFILASILVSADENAREDQNKAYEMLDNLKIALEHTIIQSDWLDVSTKMAVINKLRFIQHVISFTDWMLMPSEIESMYFDKTIIPGQHFTTMRLINRGFRDRNLSCLRSDNSFNGLPAGKPGEVNAQHVPQFNGINVPIGILGPPFYGLGLEALNYGAMGVAMGHELAHGFDKNGKNFDSSGAKKSWWKKRTNIEYDKRVDCFIKSYDNIFIPVAGRNVDGKLTINENLSDYMGFTQALKAYRIYVQKNGQEKRLPHFEHYSHEKLFTMAFANMYCEVSTQTFAKEQLESDVHSPGRARILGVLRNSADFAQIWKCSDNLEMNPKEKCKLW